MVKRLAVFAMTLWLGVMAASAQTPSNANQAFVRVWQTASAAGSPGSIAATFTFAPATPLITPTNANQVLTNVYNSSSHALQIYCVGGCPSATTIGLGVGGGTPGSVLMVDGAGNLGQLPNASLFTLCSTCNIVGGILGGGAVTLDPNYSNVSPFDGINNTVSQYLSPFSAWHANLTTYISEAMPNGADWYIEFLQRPAYVGESGNGVWGQGVLSIPPNAALGAYQLPDSAMYVGLGGGIQANLKAFGGVPPDITPAPVSAITWEILGSTSQPLATEVNNVVSSGSTVYTGPSQKELQPSTPVSEALVGVVIPYNATAKNLCFQTEGSQSANNSLVLTLRKNGTTSTALTVTIAAGAPGGFYCDSTHTVALSAGDWITWQIVNHANVNSPFMDGIEMELVPSGNATGMLVFPLWTADVANGTKSYSAFYFSGALANELTARAGMPRAVTMKNLYCIYTTPPGTNSNVISVLKNGTPGALTVTVPTTGAGTQVVSDLTHSIAFANLDAFDMQTVQAAGTKPVISSCSVEVD